MTRMNLGRAPNASRLKHSMELIVGVSGIRGIVGESLTPSVVVEFARAFGTLLEGGRVVLGRDSRPSGEMFACAAAAGLTAAGCEVTQLGITMTPTVAHAICTGHYDGGIVITASHNPGQWNGMKVLDERGLAPDPAGAERLAAIRDRGEYRNVRDGFAALQIDDQAGERHVEAVQAAVECDLRPLSGMALSRTTTYSSSTRIILFQHNLCPTARSQS